MIFHKTFADMKVNDDIKDLKNVSELEEEQRPITSEEQAKKLNERKNLMA